MSSSPLLLVLVGAVANPIVALMVGWAIGHRVAAKWGLWQKRREQTLSTTGEFYRLYGEFFAVWKLWDASLRKSASPGIEEKRWKLLERAAGAEASMETLMIKLASERVLSAANSRPWGGSVRDISAYVRRSERARSWAGPFPNTHNT